MIPHNLIRDTIGYCTESPIWWAMWTDLVTRADVREINGWTVTARYFALGSGLDPKTVIAGFTPPWRMWLISKYGYENVSELRFPRPALCALGNLGWAGRPTNDEFCYADWREYPYCNGSCNVLMSSQ